MERPNVLAPTIALSDVFYLVAKERSYQNSTSDQWIHKGTPSVEAELLLLQEYLAQARQAWAKEPGNVGALHAIRKIAAIAVRALENHGLEAGPKGPTREK